MKLRHFFWAKIATVIGVAVGGLVLAQAPANSGSAPKYYPGTITPHSATHSVYQSQASPIRAAAPTTPSTPVGSAASTTSGKPKFFNAPSDGVRPVSASEPVPPKSTAQAPNVAPAVVPLPAELTPLPTMPADAKPSLPMVNPERGPTTLPAPVKLPTEAGTLPPPLNMVEPPATATPAPAPATGSDLSPIPSAVPVPMNTSQPLTAPTPSPSLMATIPSTGNLATKQTPNVSVEYDMPESAGVGQALSYALIVKNLGTSAVSNVRVEQETPHGTTYVSSEPAAESGAEGKLVWPLGAMDAGAEKRVKVTVKPSDEGEIRGRAAVSFTAAVEGKMKVTRPKIAIAMTAPENARVGEKVTVSIKLSNTGSGPANAMTLQARLTDGLSHSAGSVIEAPLNNLAAGASITRNLEITAAKSGSQQVTLAVFADSNPAETSKVNITLVEPQLTAKQTGPTKCFVKAEPSYNIELSNPGTTTTDPVNMWTMIPEGFEFVQASEGGTFSATHKAVVWKLNGLSAGSNKTITVKLRSVAPSDGVIRTLVQSGPGETSGSTAVATATSKVKPLEAKCETAIKAEGVPAIRFEVIDMEDPVEVGKEALYEIRVMNQGTGPCSNINIVAELADNTVAGATSGPTNAKPSGNVITFETLATLPVKGEATYKVRVKATSTGDTRFRVKLTSDQIKTPISKEENTRFYKE